MDTTTAGTDNPNYLVVGLAVGVPFGVIILVLVLVIAIMLCVYILGNKETEEVEAVYIRKRFQGLSLEQQRRMHSKNKPGGRFGRRKSSVVSSSKSSTDQLSQRSGAMKENHFKLQDWQLKLTGIDVAKDSDNTDDDLDSPRTPLGAINPLLIQDSEEELTPSYEPVKKSKVKASVRIEVPPSHSRPPERPDPPGYESDGKSSDSLNPYD